MSALMDECEQGRATPGVSLLRQARAVRSPSPSSRLPWPSPLARALEHRAVLDHEFLRPAQAVDLAVDFRHHVARHHVPAAAGVFGAGPDCRIYPQSLLAPPNPVQFGIGSV